MEKPNTFDRLREIYPDCIILFTRNDSYLAFEDDAAFIKSWVGIAIHGLRYKENYVEFGPSQLDAIIRTITNGRGRFVITW